MNLAQFRELTKDLPGDTLLFKDGPDHTFRPLILRIEDLCRVEETYADKVWPSFEYADVAKVTYSPEEIKEQLKAIISS